MVVFLRNKNLPFFQGHYHQFFVFMGKYFGPRCLSVYGKGLFRWSLFCRAPGTILVPGGGSESTLLKTDDSAPNSVEIENDSSKLL